VTVTQVLQKFSENGAKARAAKRLAVDEGLKKNGVEKAHFACAVAGVSPYESAAADAILESVASCDTDEKKHAAVVAVEEVFQAVDEPLDRILLDLKADGSYERRGLDEVLEACRDVMRRVQQAYSGGAAHRKAQRRAHVAALIEATSADVKALAREAPCRRASCVLRPLAERTDEDALRLEHVGDGVLELLVKKSKELRPGAEPYWAAIAEALNELGVQRTGGGEWGPKYVWEHYLSLQSNQTPLTDSEKRMICALQWQLGTEDGIPWTKIAKQMGTGHSTNTIKNYWYATGQYRYWVECDACKNWRLLEKGCPSEPNRCGACATCTAPRIKRRGDRTGVYPRLPCLEPVIEGRWTCDCAKRQCSEPGDDVLPKTVEEAPVEAPADAAAVVGTPMALDDDNALQQPPPPDVELTTAPQRAPEDENTPMTEAPAADAVPESVAAVDGGGSAPLVQQPAARAAVPPADPAAELDASFAELKLKLTVDDASDFEDAVVALFAKVRAARAAATNSMNI
jgi:hypothetical protein